MGQSPHFYVYPLNTGRLRNKGKQLSGLSVIDLFGEYKPRKYPDGYKYPDGFFCKVLVNNGDGTLNERVTGLMWKKSLCLSGNTLDYSYSGYSYSDAEKYVAEINRQGFAGYSDWRLPTLEEGASLIEPQRSNASVISRKSPLLFTGTYAFDVPACRVSSLIWTCDKLDNNYDYWTIFLGGGEAYKLNSSDTALIQICRTARNADTAKFSFRKNEYVAQYAPRGGRSLTIINDKGKRLEVFLSLHKAIIRGRLDSIEYIDLKTNRDRDFYNEIIREAIKSLESINGLAGHGVRSRIVASLHV